MVCDNGQSRASILTGANSRAGVEEATPRWFWPGSIPNTLAVGGVFSLEAVAGLLVLVFVIGCELVYVLISNHTTRASSGQDACERYIRNHTIENQVCCACICLQKTEHTRMCAVACNQQQRETV